MPSAMIRVNSRTRDILRELAAQAGEPMQAVLERAVEQYRRQRLFDAADAAYDALRQDPNAWKEEMEERALWERTLADGLEKDESWTEEGEVERSG